MSASTEGNDTDAFAQYLADRGQLLGEVAAAVLDLDTGLVSVDIDAAGGGCVDADDGSGMVAVACASLSAEECAHVAREDVASACCVCGGGSRVRRLRSGVRSLDLSVTIVKGGPLEPMTVGAFADYVAEASRKLAGALPVQLWLRLPAERKAGMKRFVLRIGGPVSVVVDGDAWTVGAWSSCDAACSGLRSRAVSCVGPGFCAAGAIALAEPCRSELCECPLGEDFLLDCDAQAYAMFAALLLGGCCCLSCCVWCCCKMRRVRSGSVVLRFQEGSREEATMMATFEVLEDPERAISSRFSTSAGRRKKRLVRWSFDEEFVHKWLGFSGKPADAAIAAGQTPVVGPSGAAELGSAGWNGDEHPPTGDRPVSAPPDGNANDSTTEVDGVSSAGSGSKVSASELQLAYPRGAKVEYFSSGGSMWVSGSVEDAKPLARMLKSSDGRSAMVPNYHLRLASGQMRYDVGLDEIRLPLQPGEAVEVLDGTWKPARIHRLGSADPTKHGYIVEVEDGDAPASRVSARQLRCRFPAGDEVEVYFGHRQGWARCVVVDPAAASGSQELLGGRGGSLEGWRLSANWRRSAGAAGCTAVLVQREGSAVLTVPSFLVRRAAETE